MRKFTHGPISKGFRRLLKQLFKSIWMAALITRPVLAHAIAGDRNDCGHQNVVFSGEVPLKYATVTKGGNSNLYLHKEFPPKCSRTTDESCKSHSYVVSGDTLAIGRTCGPWVYVQFIGEQSISYGWVAADRLDLRSTPTHPDDISVQGLAYAELGMQRYRFRLNKGRGVPVCEAYLQRLNQTAFSNLPSCSRPENIDVPGFAWLNRVWVSTEEFNKTYEVVMDFMTNRPRTAGVGYFKNRFIAWRYDPQIDIDNDGTPDNVLLWSADDRDHPDCGNYYFGNQRRPGGMEGLIMTPDGGQIDDKKTIQVFGRSERAVGNVGLPVNTFTSPNHPRNFEHIGGSIGVFKYRRLFYFDTFYDDLGLGNFSGDRATATDPHLRDTLAVLLSEHGKTEEICTFTMNKNSR